MDLWSGALTNDSGKLEGQSAFLISSLSHEWTPLMLSRSWALHSSIDVIIAVVRFTLPSADDADRFAPMSGVFGDLMHGGAPGGGTSGLDGGKLWLIFD